MRLRKGVHFSTRHAAGELRFAVHQGAAWGVFHTRHATSSAVSPSACHPFQQGDLVLAHNGHDAFFTQFGAMTRKRRSDSAAITEFWGRGQVPIPALTKCNGVFAGFDQDHPFIVKGQVHRDLVLAWHEASGALLFVSELPDAFRAHFDVCIEVGRLTWQGEPIDLTTIERRPPPAEPTPQDTDFTTSLEVSPAAASVDQPSLTPVGS